MRSSRGKSLRRATASPTPAVEESHGLPGTSRSPATPPSSTRWEERTPSAARRKRGERGRGLRRALGDGSRRKSLENRGGRSQKDFVAEVRRQETARGSFRGFPSIRSRDPRAARDAQAGALFWRPVVSTPGNLTSTCSRTGSSSLSVLLTPMLAASWPLRADREKMAAALSPRVTMRAAG